MTPVCCDASCHKRNQQCSILNPVGQLSCTWWDATVGNALDTHCDMIFKPKPSSRQQSSALSPAPDTKVYISRWQLVQEVLRAAPRMRFIAAVALLAACQAAYGQSPAVSFHHSGHIGHRILIICLASQQSCSTGLVACMPCPAWYSSQYDEMASTA